MTPNEKLVWAARFAVINVNDSVRFMSQQAANVVLRLRGECRTATESEREAMLEEMRRDA